MPAALWEFFFLVTPILFLFLISFFPKATLTNISFSFSLQSFYSGLSSPNMKAIFNSLSLCFVNSILCLVISLPLAFFLSFRIPSAYKTFVFLMLLIPSWTNFIIKIYSWFFILKRGGMASNLLFSIGLIKTRGALLANFYSVVAGMLYCYFPFMLIPIYISINRVDKTIIEAAKDLGSTKAQIIRYIIIPLCWQSCTAGFFVVLLSSFGEFAIQDFLGGSKDIYWGNLIVNKFLVTSDYSAGAAITIIGILILFFALSIFYLISWLASEMFKQNPFKKGFKILLEKNIESKNDI